MTTIEKLRSVFAYLKDVDDQQGDDGDGYTYGCRSNALEQATADMASAIAEFEADSEQAKVREHGRVHVYIFKPSGKWYATATVDMSAFHDQDNIHGCVRAACMAEAANSKGGWGLVRTADDYLRDGWTLVCPDPHHKHSHPVMLCGPQSLDQTPNFERP